MFEVVGTHRTRARGEQRAAAVASLLGVYLGAQSVLASGSEDPFAFGDGVRAVLAEGVDESRTTPGGVGDAHRADRVDVRVARAVRGRVQGQIGRHHLGQVVPDPEAHRGVQLTHLGVVVEPVSAPARVHWRGGAGSIN